LAKRSKFFKEQIMRKTMFASLALFGLIIAMTLKAQDKAAISVEDAKAFRPGSPISFVVKLNEPLPVGAHFDLRISPTTADEEVDMGSGEAVGDSKTEFRVSGKLPEGALPGEWHISVIYLLLPGAGWTHNTIAPNDLRFKVEGKPFAIPTKADVVVSH
jgi:hypothetical protein